MTRLFLAAAVVTLAAACAESTPPVPSGVLPPGAYCYQFDDGVTSSRVEFEVDAQGGVTGSEWATVEDVSEGYYTSWQTELDGRHEDDRLILNTVTRIELDVQEAQAVWTVSADSLDLDGRIFLSCGTATAEVPTTAVLCTPAERAVLSCPLADTGMQVAVCASPDFGPESGWLAVRIGTPERLEVNHEGGPDAFRWESLMYSGGWDARVQFFVDDTEYHVFDQAIKVSMSEKDFRAGVVAPREGVEYLCLQGEDDPNELHGLSEVLQPGTFIEESWQ